MGAPYFKAICMGRALMIPGFVGDNIEGVLKSTGKTQWTELPDTVSRYGQSADQIFVTYATLEDKYGKERMKDIPLGAIAMYTYIDKLRTGLTQLMAGARSFRLDTIKRADIITLTEEAAKVSGIPYVMEVCHQEAIDIIEA